MTTPDNPAAEPATAEPVVVEEAAPDVPAAAPPPDEIVPAAIAAAPPEPGATTAVTVTPEADHLGNLKAAADRISNVVREVSNYLTQDVASWTWDEAEDLIAEAHQLADRLEARFARKQTVEEVVPATAQEPIPITIVDPPAQPTPVDEPAA